MRYINSTHLMLGNIVYGISLDEDDDLEETHLCEVISLKKSVFPFETGYEIYVSVLDDNEPHSFHRFEGIPIDEKQLFRLGFKKYKFDKTFFYSKDHLYFKDGYWIFGDIFTENWVYFGLDDMFVHELQNLYFSLTRKQLTYESN